MFCVLSLLYSFSIQHWFDSHGDDICTEDLGGLACYLREVPHGYGLPLLEGDPSYSLDFILNDVRKAGSPAMIFYMETSLRWSSDTSLTPASRAHLQVGRTSSPLLSSSRLVSSRPVSSRLVTKTEYSFSLLSTVVCPVQVHFTSHPFTTLRLPLREESVVWHTGKWLVPGQVIYSPADHTPFLHAHRSFLRGMWAFAATPEELGLTPDLLERTPEEPGVPGGWATQVDDFDMCWIPRRGEGEGGAKRALMDRVGASKAGPRALRCWFEPEVDARSGGGGSGGAGMSLLHVRGTDTSPAFPKAWQQNWEDSWYAASLLLPSDLTSLLSLCPLQPPCWVKTDPRVRLSLRFQHEGTIGRAKCAATARGRSNRATATPSSPSTPWTRAWTTAAGTSPTSRLVHSSLLSPCLSLSLFSKCSA